MGWCPTGTTATAPRTPYELNVTWYSALNRDEADEPLELQVSRFIASRAIALALAGVPGIYLPSVFGSKNDSDAVRAGEEARSINRDTIDVPALLNLLGDHRTWASKVARRFGRLIRARIGAPAFHPQAAQRVLAGNDAVFAVLRTARDGKQRVLALASVSPQVQQVSYALKELGSVHARPGTICSRRAASRPPTARSRSDCGPTTWSGWLSEARQRFG